MRKLLIQGSVLLAALFAAGASQAWSKPDNDQPRSAAAIQSLYSPVLFDYYGASVDVSEPSICPALSGDVLAQSLWFEFHPGENQKLDAIVESDLGADYVAVFRRAPGGLESLGCAAGRAATRVRFDAQIGERYLVEVATRVVRGNPTPGTVRIEPAAVENGGTLSADEVISARTQTLITPAGIRRSQILSFRVYVTCDIPVAAIDVYARLEQDGLSTQQHYDVPCLTGSGSYAFELYSPGMTRQYFFEDGPAVLTLTGTEETTNFDVTSGPIDVTVETGRR